MSHPGLKPWRGPVRFRSRAPRRRSLWNCPLCGGTMQVVGRRSPAQLLLRSPPLHPHAGVNPQPQPSLQPQPLPAKLRSRPATAGRRCPQQLCRSSGPAPPRTKPLGSRGGGFLQVAVTEASLENSSSPLPVVKWSPRSSTNQDSHPMHVSAVECCRVSHSSRRTAEESNLSTCPGRASEASAGASVSRGI